MKDESAYLKGDLDTTVADIAADIAARAPLTLRQVKSVANWPFISTLGSLPSPRATKTLAPLRGSEHDQTSFRPSGE